MSTTSNIAIPAPLASTSIAPVSDECSNAKLSAEQAEALAQVSHYKDWLWDTERYYGHDYVLTQATCDGSKFNAVLLNALKTKGPMADEELDNPKKYAARLQQFVEAPPQDTHTSL